MRGLVALLLRLYPVEFRRRFGPDMLATFESRWQENASFLLAARTVCDLISAAVRIRLAPPAPSPNHDPLESGKGDNLMTVLLQDLRFALRTLLRSRGFTAVALITLTLGIGLNTAMFSVAHAVLWSSLPYPHPERLVFVGEADTHNPSNYWGTSWPNLVEWRVRTRSFEHLAGVMNVQHILRGGETPVRINGAAVTSDFFGAMGVAPLMGRVFDESEDRKGGPAVIVISHRMWKDRLGGDPAILSRSLLFGKTQYAIVGVMPAGFEYAEAEFWTPLRQEMGPDLVTHHNIWAMNSIGRLRPGVSADAAGKEVEAVTAQIRKDHPETRRGLAVRVSPLRDDLSHDIRPALLILLGAVGCVLLIVCGNMAGLMLVRGTARVREMAIRRALGVGSGRLLRQLFTESAVLAVIGGLAGIGLAVLATRALSLLTSDHRLLNVPIDGSVLAFAAVVTLTTTVLFGTAPALSATRVGASEALRSGSRSGVSRTHTRVQRSLVVLEVALCMVLLAGAGLLMKSFHRLFEVNPGFQSERLVIAGIALPLSYDSDDKVIRFYRRLTDRLSTLPGVRGVTIASRLPISGSDGTGDIAIEGRASAEGELGEATFHGVMPDYFKVMGIPLIRGRLLEARDELPGLHNIVISQSFARRFWPDADPVGKRVRLGPRDTASWLTIVGVVGDIRQIRLDSAPLFAAYDPLNSVPSTRFEIAVRAAGDETALMPAILGSMRQLDPQLLIEKAETMSERIDDTVAPRRLNLILFQLFAVIALLLSAIGLYGVVAYAAGQRTHEFGIRVALGARGSDVSRLVMRQGLLLAMLGISIGVVATLYISRLMTRLLFDTQPNDLPTLALVAALLTTVALLACWIPARRATRVAPLDALRNE